MAAGISPATIVAVGEGAGVGVGSLSTGAGVAAGVTAGAGAEELGAVSGASAFFEQAQRASAPANATHERRTRMHHFLPSSSRERDQPRSTIASTFATAGLIASALGAWSTPPSLHVSPMPRNSF